MSRKFVLRTLRNIVIRDHPYFAHLAITHRCNLRCRFCHIREEPIEELDTEGMKQVIDILDEMGVAVLSISGGGEPLLRSDFATILNYAAGKGMYTKITSNGTMPLARYQELLRSEATEIGISLDGVRGNDLPYSHVGTKILQTIRYLNDHLPPQKQLTLNVTVSERNRDQVDEIVDYCAREFPKAKVWLNPVVAGAGKLRTETESKVNPDYLDRSESPTLLTAKFYKEGVSEQFRNATYDWGCRAGRMFFDIKPNGDFWICQDQMAQTPLNVLEPAFKEKFRQTDVSHRRQCIGCTYSCYFVTQKGFEPRNWPDMAGLWWKSNTSADEPCRGVAEKYGWLAGLLSLAGSRMLALARKPAMGLFLALMLGAGVACGQHPSSSTLGEEIVARMEQANGARRRALNSYQSQRRYVAQNSRLRCYAQVTVELRFTAPGEKRFRILEREGSEIVYRKVIRRLLETESANERDEARLQADICRRNYRFTLSRLDEQAGAYVFQVEPWRSNKYLFRGEVWVNGQSYAIQRIEAEPAQSPSSWVRRTHFVHEYADFGGFWFPVRHRTVVELRLFGKSTLEIDYYDYRWESRRSNTGWMNQESGRAKSGGSHFVDHRKPKRLVSLRGGINRRLNARIGLRTEVRSYCQPRYGDNFIISRLGLNVRRAGGASNGRTV